MSTLDEKLGTYTEDVRTKCGMEPDVDLLRKVAVGLGPSIYSAGSETVAASDRDEIGRIRETFLKDALGLTESDDLDGGIAAAFDTYGPDERPKYRAVVYYLLVKRFGKEEVYA